MRALANAYAQAQETRLQDIGKTLVEDVDRQLKAHVAAKLLEAQLRGVMNEGHAELVRALDPLAEDGAVARFLKSLRDELKGADEDRAKQLTSALNALDANDQADAHDPPQRAFSFPGRGVQAAAGATGTF